MGLSDSLEEAAAEIVERKKAEEALHRSEEQFRMATEAANLGVFIQDFALNRFRADKRAMRLFGFREGEDFGFEELKSRVHPDDQARCADAFKRLLDPTGHGVREVLEVRVVLPDGDVRWVSISGCVHIEGGGEQRRVVSVVGTALDISERKQAEEAQARMQKLEALGTLAGGIAHDFNNILLAIRGNSVLAAAELADDHPAMQYLAEIDRAGKRGAALVKQVLAFSRPSEGHRTVQKLGPILEEARTFLRAVVPALIDIQVRSNPSCPSAAVDPSQVNQALVNLSMNSADAIGSRPGFIQISLDDVDFKRDAPDLPTGLSTGRHLRVSVADDGEGMDSSTLRRAFDPFFTTKPPDKGTGLGLSIVHGIMKSHGGGVSVSSQPGNGTTVSLYFPVAEARPAAEDSPTRPLIRQDRGLRLLFIDDDEALVFLGERILRRLGYSVTTFTNPILALKEFRAHPSDFAAVITDLSMPGMTGFELAQELMTIQPGIPIVLTSGYVTPEDEAAAYQLGVKAVIRKPDTVDEMAATLDRIFKEAKTR